MRDAKAYWRITSPWQNPDFLGRLMLRLQFCAGGGPRIDSRVPRLESSWTQRSGTCVGTRDDLGGDDLAQRRPATLGSFDGGIRSGDLARDDDRHRWGAVLLHAQFDIGGFEPRLGRFHDGGQMWAE